MRSSTEHRSRSWRGVVAVVAVAVSMASGCGTTTKRGTDTSADTVEGGSPSELSVARSERLDDQSATTDGGAAGSRTASRAPAGAASSGAAAGAASPGAPAAEAPSGGPVGDGRPVELGIYLYDSESTGALFTGFGYEGAWGDGRRQAEIFVEHLNETGGILGHPIEPIIYEADLATGADTNDQAACELFTQDHRVIAVVSNNPNPNEVMLKCLDAQKTPVFEANLTSYADWTNAAYSRYQLFAHSGVSWDRLAGPYVDQLVAMDYFSGWDTTSGAPGSAEVKIGVLAPDDEHGREVVDEHLEPALARHGHRFHAKAFTASTDYSNVVLSFRSEGITHVFFMGLGGPLFFTPQAESQRYRPRYATTTKAWPLGSSAGMVPEGQLRGALGVGWSPLADVPATRRPDSSPTEVACMKAMTDGGEDMSSEVASINASNICEAGWLHRAAFEAGGGLTPEHWLAGLESLGASVVSVQALATFYGPGRHDAIAAIRGIAYRESCSCFEYTTSSIEV